MSLEKSPDRGTTPWNSLLALAEPDVAVEIYRNATRYLSVTGRQISDGDELADIDDLIDELADSASTARGSSKDKATKSDNVIKLGKADSTKSGVLKKETCRLIERGKSNAEIFDNRGGFCPMPRGDKYAKLPVVLCEEVEPTREAAMAAFAKSQRLPLTTTMASQKAHHSAKLRVLSRADEVT